MRVNRRRCSSAVKRNTLIAIGEGSPSLQRNRCGSDIRLYMYDRSLDALKGAFFTGDDDWHREPVPPYLCVQRVMAAFRMQCPHLRGSMDVERESTDNYRHGVIAPS
jgi:hypothetical protein